MMIDIDPETEHKKSAGHEGGRALNKNNAGVYATVVRSGTIRVGDEVSLLPGGVLARCTDRAEQSISR